MIMCSSLVMYFFKKWFSPFWCGNSIYCLKELWRILQTTILQQCIIGKFFLCFLTFKISYVNILLNMFKFKLLDPTEAVVGYLKLVYLK